MGRRNDYEKEELRASKGIVRNIIKKRQDYLDKRLSSFLIVEGDSDSRFYKTLVDTNKCHVTNAYNKSTALEVLSLLEEAAFPGVLAIVDADFDTLEGKLPPSPNVLFTDTHDLETMLIKSPALEKALGILGSEGKIEQVEQSVEGGVRALLLESGMTIGYLRWVSLRENLSLTFEKLEFVHFIKEGLDIDLSRFITTVKNKSQRPNIANIQLVASIRDLRTDTHDPWHVCCGHDLVCILSIALRKTIGSYNSSDVRINPDNLANFLLAAFERAHFYKTQLYLSIQQWEKANTPFVILALE